MRTKLAGLRAQQPLLGQVQVGKGQLIQNLQGKRLLRGALFPGSCSTCSNPSTRPQTNKMHPGIVDTADIGKGKPITTKAAVETEKGAYPVSLDASVEL